MSAMSLWFVELVDFGFQIDNLPSQCVDVGLGRKIQPGQDSFVRIGRLMRAPAALARGPDGSALRSVGTWEPCAHALDRSPTALDAAPIKGPGFIGEHARDTDAREDKIAGGSEETSTRGLRRRLGAHRRRGTTTGHISSFLIDM